jgi:hypothetical protein
MTFTFVFLPATACFDIFSNFREYVIRKQSSKTVRAGSPLPAEQLVASDGAPGLTRPIQINCRLDNFTNHSV